MDDQQQLEEANNREFYLIGESSDAHFYEGAVGVAKPMVDGNGFQRGQFRNLERTANQDAWEEKMIRRSGVGHSLGADTSVAIDEETKQIQVKSIMPGFLNSKLITNKIDTVDVIKDRTSDFAKLAEKGSMRLKEWREKKSQNKMRQKYWELGGSQMGQIVGIKGEAQFVAKDVEDTIKERIENTFSTPASSANVLPELLKMIRENQIVIVVGETGSGKTTQLPLALWKNMANPKSKMIVGCTQPRRVAAMSVAKRVAEEHGSRLGDTIGYSIRFEDVTSENTRVKYLTDGILLRESLQDPDLDRYSHIVMDEAHERSLNTDVLFGIAKQITKRRNDFRLIVTSATMDREKFQHFFGDCEYFIIPGRTFPVDVLYSKVSSQDYVEDAVKQILEIHLTLPPGDILVFMTGEEDINATCEMVAERLSDILTQRQEDDSEESKLKKKLLEESLVILPMYSSLPGDMQAKIFQPALKGQRKCVVSTNVAETSITVDGIKYVIDSGFSKTNVYNTKIGMDTLRLVPISQAAANQRAGRAGRTSAGHCYRLYTSFQFKHEMLSMTVPEIQRTNLCNVVLLLKNLGIEDIGKFEFMDPPPRELIENALYQLWVLGALDDEGKLTEGLGRKMAEFPLEPSLSKLMIMAQREKCTSEILTITAMLSVPDVFFRPKEREQEADTSRERFIESDSDHLTLLNVYNQWVRNKMSSQFCNTHYLHHKTLMRALDIRSQIRDVMTKQKILEVSLGRTDEGMATIRKVICSAFFPNSAKLKGNGVYINLLNGLPCYLHPSSSFFGAGVTPDYVVYHEMVMTTKEYMRQASKVDPDWLVEFGSMFFHYRGQVNSKRVALLKEEKHSNGEKTMRQSSEEKAKEEVEEEEDDETKLNLSRKISNNKKRKMGITF